MTHNNAYLCTSIPLKVKKPIVGNGGVFYLQLGCVSITTAETLIELNSQHFCELEWTDTING